MEIGYSAQKSQNTERTHRAEEH